MKTITIRRMKKPTQFQAGDLVTTLVKNQIMSAKVISVNGDKLTVHSLQHVNQKHTVDAKDTKLVNRLK